MGMQDRDWYRDERKKARAAGQEQKPGKQPERPRKRRGPSLAWLIIWVAIIAVAACLARIAGA